jgi:hypothetical protein
MLGGVFVCSLIGTRHIIIGVAVCRGLRPLVWSRPPAMNPCPKDVEVPCLVDPCTCARRTDVEQPADVCIADGISVVIQRRTKRREDVVAVPEHVEVGCRGVCVVCRATPHVTHSTVQSQEISIILVIVLIICVVCIELGIEIEVFMCIRAE